MQARNWQRSDRFSLALVFVAGVWACESGDKQIGGLDGAGASETNGDGEGDLGDGDGDGDGETGEACTGDGEPEIECAEAQDVSFNWGLMAAPGLDEDALWTCAANVESDADGHVVTLTHCSDSLGQPQSDTLVSLSGDWPEPEFADGDQPLTEFRYIHGGLAEPGHTTFWLILRPVGQERIALLGFKGNELVIEPSYLGPLTLALADLGCPPNTITCNGGIEGQMHRIGVEVGYGCAHGIAADGTMLTDLGLEEGTGVVYDVLVDRAETYDCEPDIHETLLEFGIVGRTL
jgi:hypothetical protein